jgi:hypothetical protein
MATLQEIVIDALYPAGLARFWAAALEEYAIRPYDPAEIARLARLGLTPETDTSVALDGPGPTLFFQKTGQRKSGRNRMHWDLRCNARAEEVARLVRLGASVRDVHASFTVMLDPEGNEFCVQEPEPK